MKHTEKNIFLQQSHQFRIESHINDELRFCNFILSTSVFVSVSRSLSLFKFPIHFIRETLYIFTYIHRVTLEFTPVYENLEDAVLLRYARIYIYIYFRNTYTYTHTRTNRYHAPCTPLANHQPPLLFHSRG